MTEPGVGRLLPACLHQAITDELPDRLEFYEEWLTPEGLRDGSIGLAPVTGVLGFLRTEGDVYHRVMKRAGQLAGEWTVASLGSMHRQGVAWLPRAIRARAALRVAGAIVQNVGHASRASSRVRGNQAKVQVDASVFCAVREAQPAPLCGFYLASSVAVLGAFGIVASGRLEQCRASGGSTCVIELSFSDASRASDPAIAA